MRMTLLVTSVNEPGPVLKTLTIVVISIAIDELLRQKHSGRSN